MASFLLQYTAELQLPENHKDLQNCFDVQSRLHNSS